MTSSLHITIETSDVEVEGDDTAFAGMTPGHYVVLSVTDAGYGMSPEILAKVTEPFFTTKEPGKGTGLGLSMAFGFAKQSGGSLKIYSEVGIGTTVRLFFPAVSGAARSDGKDGRPGPQIELGRETILVVEDQADVAELAREMLEGFGYTVIEAANGPKAMELIKNEGRIDALFSDLIMPGGMNGVALAREARRLRPALKVLLTTGYAESSIERVDSDGKAFEWIAKPYKRAELARKLRQVIVGPNGIS